MLATQQYVRSDDPTGQKLDAVSDAVDDLNVRKFMVDHPELTKEQAEKDAYAQSEFDKDKQKESFRQYEENTGPFRFYTSVPVLHRA